MTSNPTDTPKTGLTFFEKLSRRKLRNYLFLDTELQFKFAILLAVVGLFTATYFIALFYIYTKDSLLQLENYVPEYLLTGTFMTDSYKRFLYTVGFAMGGEFVFVMLLGLFFSHRVAGPLYALGQKLRAITEGKIPEKVKLRKNDFLTDFATELNKTIDTLEVKQLKAKEALEALKSGNSQSCEEKLKQII